MHHHNPSHAGHPLIVVKGLQKSYFNGDMETSVLHGIDLTINEGEFVSIMGPSGSGKSTLMHILGFLDSQTKGEYIFQGKPIDRMEDDELAVIRATLVSFVFQSFNLIPKTSVYNNVILPLLYHPTIPESERRKRTLDAIEIVKLSDKVNNLSNQLSGGQQQRVAIARALVTNPKIIFADEPTGNLDSASGVQIMTTLQDLHRQGHTIILVTHEQKTAQHAERIIHILDGKIASDSRDFKRVMAGSESHLK